MIIDGINLSNLFINFENLEPKNIFEIVRWAKREFFGHFNTQYCKNLHYIMGIKYL